MSREMTPSRGLLLCLVSAVLVVAGGCASPPRENSYYDILLPPGPGNVEEAPGAGPTGSLGSLDIDRVAVPPHLDGPEIFYRVPGHRAGFYGYHHWVRPLSSSLASELHVFFERTGRFSSVTGPGEKDREPALTLSITVREFNEEDGGGGNWFARVALACRLKDSQSGRTRSFTIEISEPVQPRNAAGTVEALNEAYFLAVLDILTYIERFMEEAEGIK